MPQALYLTKNIIGLESLQRIENVGLKAPGITSQRLDANGNHLTSGRPSACNQRIRSKTSVAWMRSPPIKPPLAPDAVEMVCSL